ncbi:hypothetical protein [Streptomyces canus]|uniref:hypothetical protein n=1 Tax=Streptomyces canus TaxID=58343 RepID=UPI0038648A33|nr:hypothetical protein OH824_23130 [Streptomyces canus]
MSEPTPGQPPRPDPSQQQWGQGAQQRQPQGWSQPPYGASPPYGAPPRKKRRKWPWVLLVLVLLVAGGCAAILAGVSHEVSKTVEVEYTVTGNARDVTIAYSVWNDDGISSRSENHQDLAVAEGREDEGLHEGGIAAHQPQRIGRNRHLFRDCGSRRPEDLHGVRTVSGGYLLRLLRPQPRTRR